jgi:type II secretory pathway pseudopilin PulG
MMSRRFVRVGLALVALVAILAVGWWTMSAREIYKLRRVLEIQLDLVADGLRIYARAHGKFPTAQQGLEELVSTGQFERKAFMDPWGKPLTYRCLRPDCSRAEVRSVNGDSGEASFRIVDSSSLQLN